LDSWILTSALCPALTPLGEAALVSAVLRTASQQDGLLPALMMTYVSADFVVGLDVDKDSFDKFSMRSCIDMILEELWKDEPCRRSVLLTPSFVLL
jgi:hypothetical protein